MSVSKARRPRLSQTIVEDLAAEIISGSLPPGTALPTEPQLGARFGVSRTVIREAMAQLAHSGLVRIRQGSGTAVRPRDHWRELDPELVRIRAARGLIDDLVPDLLAIRRMIEVTAAGEAACRREDDDLRRLSLHLEQMAEHLTDLPAYNDADIAFHNALIQATRNHLLFQVMQPINELRRIGSVMTSSRAESIVLASMAGHEAIFDAVRRQDASGARSAMANHIAQFERDMLGALAGKTRVPRPAAVSAEQNPRIVPVSQAAGNGGHHRRSEQ